MVHKVNSVKQQNKSAEVFTYNSRAHRPLDKLKIVRDKEKHHKLWLHKMSYLVSLQSKSRLDSYGF